MNTMAHYFSVLIPFTAKEPTAWHPTKPVGPFSTLSRGAFATRKEAHAWAKAHIPGHAYSVRRY